MMKRKFRMEVPMVAIAATMLFSSCGKKTFAKLEYSTSAVAAQYVYLKPKLDLVIFQDNSDSLTNQTLAALKPQMNNFLSGLDTNWEYRVIVMPLLTQLTSLSSKYVLATDCSTVSNVGQCLGPSQVDVFNNTGGNAGWINNRISNGNIDYGFNFMNLNINTLISANFLRPDAALAMMVISDNDDQTNVAYMPQRPDGATVFAIDYNHPTTQASFTAYKNYFVGLKTSIALNKFYAVVAQNNYMGCNGAPGISWAGRRYMDLASALGGSSFELCGNGLYGAMSAIRSSLQTVVQIVVFNYVVLKDEPQPETIVLKKNGSVVPNSATNGWTYAGYLANQPTSYYPVSGNVKSGYMIRLNGTAEFKGTDAISIDYQKK